MVKKNSANHLDEMQDQKLLKLEEYGFWIMFWGLAVSIVVQLIIGGTIKEVLGEIIILFLGSVYLSATTLKNGLWTRTSVPSPKGNAVISIIPAVLIGGIHGIRMIQNNKTETKSLLFTAAIIAAVYAGCFILLEVFRITYSKRRAALDDTDGKESEG